MNNRSQETARIYQFPAGGRAALGGKRWDQLNPTTPQGAERVNEVVCSGSWYHEAAIQEERGRDH